MNHFTNKIKKTKVYETKTFTERIVQEKHFLTHLMSLENNHPTDMTIVEDLQIKEVHVVSHKVDIVDQTVKTTNIEIIIQDQTQTETITQIITGIVQTQIPDIDIFLKDRSRNSSNNRNRNYSNNRNRQYQNNRS